MFKIKFLRNILLTSIAVVVLFPLYDIFIAYPSFIQALSDEAQDQSVRISTHLSSSLNLQEVMLYSDIQSIDASEIEAIKRDLNIMKIKIYSDAGETLYTTDSDDMHGIGNKKEFKEIITQGKVFSKVKKEGAHSLEGKPIRSVQFVETYVPIMRAHRFLGAIEIYYDISIAKERFDNIRSQATMLVIILACGLFALLLITSLKASRVIAERDRIAEEREALIDELRDALTKVKTLKGLLPICCSCNKIRDKNESWTDVDIYISRNSDAEFSHGYCPDCEKIHFPGNFK